MSCWLQDVSCGVQGGLRRLGEAQSFRTVVPGHLALLERVLEVLAGTAPTFSDLCGLCPRSVEILARPGAAIFGIFWVCVFFCHTKD